MAASHTAFLFFFSEVESISGGMDGEGRKREGGGLRKGILKSLHNFLAYVIQSLPKGHAKSDSGVKEKTNTVLVLAHGHGVCLSSDDRQTPWGNEKMRK